MAGLKLIGTTTDSAGWYARQSAALHDSLARIAAQAEERRREREEKERAELEGYLGVIQSADPISAAAAGQDLVARYGDRYPWIQHLVGGLNKRAAVASRIEGAGSKLDNALSTTNQRRDQMTQLVEALNNAPATGGPAGMAGMFAPAGQAFLEQQPEPFYEAYGELNPVEQQMARAYYKSMGVELPVPDFGELDAEIQQVYANYGSKSPQARQAVDAKAGLIPEPGYTASLRQQQDNTLQRLATEAENAVAQETLRQQNRLAIQQQRAADQMRLKTTPGARAAGGEGAVREVSPEKAKAARRTLLNQRARELRSEMRDQQAQVEPAERTPPPSFNEARKLAADEQAERLSPELAAALQKIKAVRANLVADVNSEGGIGRGSAEIAHALRTAQDEALARVAAGDDPEVIAEALERFLAALGQ